MFGENKSKIEEKHKSDQENLQKNKKRILNIEKLVEEKIRQKSKQVQEQIAIKFN